MELVPEKVGSSVVVEVKGVCKAGPGDCDGCTDYAVAVHNWLLSNELKYLIIDFQDEKDVCHEFIVELIQLRKRMRYPFLFAGVMPRPKKIFEAHTVNNDLPVFVSPDEAILALQEVAPELLTADYNGVVMSQPIPVSRPRHTIRLEDGTVQEVGDGDLDGEAEAED